MRYLMALFALALCTGASAAPPSGGIYTIIDASTLLPPPPKEKNPPPSQGAITTKTLKMQGVDGLLIHLRWAAISTGTETYKWKALDDAVQLAINQNKRFEIGIVTGAQQPTWVWAPTASGGLGATHGAFQVNASSAGTCPSFTMAPPYDPIYLSAFADLLHQLSAHLRAQGTYKHLALVKLFGMTTTTDELRLPAVDHCPGGSDPVKTWRKLGYTPAKVEAAWKTMLQDYLKYFPDKSFSIGFIGVNAFPGINNQGDVITGNAAKAFSAQFVARLIKDAGAAMPGHLAVGFDSLSLDVPASVKSYYSSRAQLFRDAVAADARVGWQTNELLGEYPAGGAACKGTTLQDATPCENSAQFRQMLFQGIYPRGKANTPPALQGVYMEAFPQNLTQWPNAVRDAHDNLAIWNGGR
jgi:hypothetical protein